MQTRGGNIEQPIFDDADDRAEYERRLARRTEELDQTQSAISRIEQKLREKLAEDEARRIGEIDIDDLRYRFYRDSWDALPNFEEIKHEDEGVLPKGKFDLAPRTRNNSFGFVFEGSLRVPSDGKYTFHVDSDDGVRFTLDRDIILTYDGIHGLGAEKSTQVHLHEGHVPIKLEYFQRDGGLGLRVDWSGPGFKRRSLAASGSEAKADIRQIFRTRGHQLLGEQSVEKYRNLRRELEKIKARNVSPKMALCVTEHGSDPPETFVLLRGSAHAPGPKVSPGFPELLDATLPAIPKRSDADRTTGLRTILARWLASPNNKLTSRVMVNRIWQYHFGRGIVRSPNNFGMLGTPPTHPELLDWMAAEFVRRGWSIKKMHRLIMKSSTYRMDSRANPKGLEKDPNNDLFWRFDMRRLTAEEIRDSILSVNGSLNPKMFGPSIYELIPKEVLQGQSQPGANWGKSSDEERTRRSIYIHVKRSLLTPILETFDLADPDSSCPVRFSTTQPTQALAMLNSDFLRRAAQVFANRVREDAGDDIKAQVGRALELVTSRSPSQREIDDGMRLIHDLIHREQVKDDQALNYFCLLALNLNEFVYLD